jgi:hypothetical protein
MASSLLEAGILGLKVSRDIEERIERLAQITGRTPGVVRDVSLARSRIAGLVCAVVIDRGTAHGADGSIGAKHTALAFGKGVQRNTTTETIVSPAYALSATFENDAVTPTAFAACEVTLA